MTGPITAAEFMAHAVTPMDGNTAWANRYAETVRQVLIERASHAPRTLQRHLGPSELGVECDRQVVGKMAGHPYTNHVSDPWPSIVGTAVHAWLAENFLIDNQEKGVIRWVTESRVTPHPDHPGTGDLYDAMEQCVGDWKCLGSTTMAKLKRHGPPRKYLVQMLLYALGFRNLGLPVKRVALLALPRTGSSLEGVYVWERELTAEDDALIAQVFEQTRVRAQMADLLAKGLVRLDQIPAVPDEGECVFCPFFRPEAAYGKVPGCPGPRKDKS